jgi:hypothetical protein
MRLYSPPRHAGKGMVVNGYVHPKCELSKGSFCETRPYTGESRCTGWSDLLGTGGGVLYRDFEYVKLRGL